MSKEPSALGRRVKEIRTAKKLSQHALATDAGIDQGTISKLEGGQFQTVSAEILGSLARGLGVTFAELMGEAPAPAMAPGQTMAAAFGASSAYRLCDIQPSPLNPRKHFDQDALEELAASIASKGLLQNLVIRHAPGGVGYQVVAGERRYRALKLLAERGQWDPDGLTVPAKLIEGDDAEHLALALLENLQRQDVNPMEEANAFAQLQALDPGRWSTKAIAESIGTSQRHVQQRLALVERLAEPAQAALREGRMTFAMARVLTMAPPKQQAELVKSIGNFGTADQLKNVITSGLVPTSRAIFDLSAYRGQIVENPETGTRYFSDKATFMTAQREAVAARAEELKREWAWVDVVESYYVPTYSYEAELSDDRAVAGAIVQIDPLDGKVQVLTGRVRKKGEDPEEKQARIEASAAASQARQAAHDAFKLALVRHLAEEPGTALRLWLLDKITSGYSAKLVSNGNYSEGLPSEFFNGGPLSPLAGMVAKGQGSGKQHLKPDVSPEAALAALERMPDERIANAVAAAAAVQLYVDWSNLNPALHHLARRWKIAIPDHLKPDQLDIEDEANAVRAAAEGEVPAAPSKNLLQGFLLEVADQVLLPLSEFEGLAGPHAAWILASGYVRVEPPGVDGEAVVVLEEEGDAWLDAHSDCDPHSMAEPAEPLAKAAA